MDRTVEYKVDPFNMTMDLDLIFRFDTVPVWILMYAVQKLSYMDILQVDKLSEVVFLKAVFRIQPKISLRIQALSKWNASFRDLCV